MLSTAEEKKGKEKRKWKEKEVHDLDLIDVPDQGCNCTLRGQRLYRMCHNRSQKDFDILDSTSNLEDGMKDPMVIIVTPLTLTSGYHFYHITKALAYRTMCISPQVL